MICPMCDKRMESMGYGDERCPACKHIEYSESIEEFEARIAPPKEDNETI